MILPRADDAVRGFLNEAQHVRDTDAAAPQEGPLRADRVEDGELVRDVILPGRCGERRGGALGIALVHADDGELVREIEGIDRAR